MYGGIYAYAYKRHWFIWWLWCHDVCVCVYAVHSFILFVISSVFFFSWVNLRRDTRWRFLFNSWSVAYCVNIVWKLIGRQTFSRRFYFLGHFCVTNINSAQDRCMYVGQLEMGISYYYFIYLFIYSDWLKSHIPVVLLAYWL